MGDLSVGVAPNFGASCAVMGQIVVGIGKLVEHEIAAFCHFRVGIVPRGFDAVGERNGCPKGLHCQNTLAGGIFGHRKFNFNAVEAGNHGQRNARVATCGLNEFDARLYLAAFHGAANHAVGGAVFHAAAWVVAFQFAK